MPRRNLRSLAASSALTKRWEDKFVRSFQSTATMTEKYLATQATQTEATEGQAIANDACDDIGTNRKFWLLPMS